MGQLNCLVELDLGGNQLTEFPRGVATSSSLTFLNLANNRIRYLYHVVTKKGELRFHESVFTFKYLGRVKMIFVEEVIGHQSLHNIFAIRLFSLELRISC